MTDLYPAGSIDALQYFSGNDDDVFFYEGQPIVIGGEEYGTESVSDLNTWMAILPHFAEFNVEPSEDLDLPIEDEAPKDVLEVHLMRITEGPWKDMLFTVSNIYDNEEDTRITFFSPR
jgi:hypothetical protein